MPPTVDALYQSGVEHFKASRFVEAFDQFRQITDIDPAHTHAIFYQAAICHQQGQDEQAVALIHQVLAISPRFPQAHHNLCIALRNLGRFDEAIEACRQAIDIDPQSATAHFLLGLLLIQREEYDQGWREMEWRWKCPGFEPDRRNLPARRWNGEDLSGQSILIQNEQGFGDMLQFIRYAPLIAKRAQRVVVTCPAPLVGLFKNSLPGIGVFDSAHALPNTDYQCPLLSVPLVFGNIAENIPREVPYLKASAGDVQKWRARLAGDSSKLKVGIAWASRPFPPNRSIPLVRFAPLARVTEAGFYSLQTGQAAAQASQPPAGMRLIDLSGELKTFAETAGLIADLDLVISVDTAVVHLAGAMGKPVWLLLRYPPDWRWSATKDQSPWYPTLRIFRQKSPDDWDSVLEEVADALSVFCG